MGGWLGKCSFMFLLFGQGVSHHEYLLPPHPLWQGHGPPPPPRVPFYSQYRPSPRTPVPQSLHVHRSTPWSPATQVPGWACVLCAGSGACYRALIVIRGVLGVSGIRRPGSHKRGQGHEQYWLTVPQVYIIGGYPDKTTH
ncbi:hypothetical protein JB92DRAFT_410946 [Gautieria morchelliformis]|nr:hypothetical protein JB92DRAFT_410946 [Gautieria morchelliformis]